MTHTVSFRIDVTADTPADAAAIAWRLLSNANAPFPVAEVIPFDSTGEPETIDLQELADIAQTEA